MNSGQQYVRVPAAIAIVCSALLAWGCGQTSVTELAGPDPVRCQVTLAADTRTIGADGGAASVSVDASRDCTWTASTEASWATLGTTTGQGAGTIRVSFAASQQPTVRTAVIAVNNQRIEIAQEARPCRFTLSSSRADVGAAGGPLSVSVATAEACTWRASTSEPWLQVGSDSRSGPGNVTIAVAPNGGAPREGVVTIADQRFTVAQGAAGVAPPPIPGCTATLAPTALEVSAAGSTESVRLEIGPQCDWTATSAATWLSVAAPAAGRGPANIRITVAANTGAARMGAVAIAGQQVMVRQAATAVEPCTFAIDPSSRDFESAGGDAQVQVTTRAGCEWTASSPAGAPWVTMTTARGTGTGPARYSVQTNTTTSPRSATLTIAGRPHAVTQAAAAPACTYSIDPASLSIPAAGGPGLFRVATQSGCAWSVTGAPSWLTIATPGPVTGPGEVSYSVQANPAAEARTATLTAGGRTHAVTQAGAAPACTYAVTPASRTVPAAGGPAQFRLTTQSGCAWTASAGAAWVTVTTAPGTGEADINYTVQANTATESRQATISVGGQTHTVTQEGAAPACTFTLAPSALTIPAAGGTGRFSVTTGSTCTWSATTGGAAWLTITSGTGTVTGPGEVTYTVQGNTATTPRTATITAGGQSHTVTQEAAPCTYSLTPSSLSFAAAGGEGRFTVTTQAGCAWTPAAGASWLTIASGTGPGPGEVVYTVQANSASEPRSAAITVGGQSHGVTQAGAAVTPPPSPPPSALLR